MTGRDKLDVLIVGAGFSGIATAAALRRYGVRNICLIEAGAVYGAFWANTYDRISLHSPWHGLPDDGGLNDSYPIFKPRADVLHYLARYAERHLLGDVTVFGESLKLVEFDADHPERPWQVQTSRGCHHCRYLVIATGYCRKPRMPALPGADHFDAPLCHSAEYRNSRPYRGQRVLVAGSGNSAFEIATDLVEGGAATVTLLVHAPRWVVPMQAFEAAMLEARAAGAYSVNVITAAHPTLPGSPEYAAYVDAFDTLLRRIAVDVSAFGIATPSYGPWHAALSGGRVGVFDHGAVALMKAGAIEVINDRITRMGGNRVDFSLRGTRVFDAVIMAAGFEPGLESIVSDPALVRRDDVREGVYPVTDQRCRSTVRPGLYFVGFDMSPFGGMAHGHWGFEVGEKIATALGTFSDALRPAEFGRAPWAA